MKIIAKDGLEFQTVEACLEYEESLNAKEVLAKRQAEDVNIAKYVVQKYNDVGGEVYEEGREAIFIHTLSNHRMVANNIAQSLYGQQIDFIDKVPIGANVYKKYTLKKVSNSSEYKFCEEELNNKRAIVVELNDVPKVFDANECRYFIPSIGGQASFTREYSEDEKSTFPEMKEESVESNNYGYNEEPDESTSEKQFEIFRPVNGVFKKMKVTESELGMFDLPSSVSSVEDGMTIEEFLHKNYGGDLSLLGLLSALLS